MNSFKEINPEQSGGDKSAYKKNLDIIRDIAYFAGMPLEVLKLLAYLCKRVNYQEGEFVFEQGDVSDRVYYILEGKAEILRTEGSDVLTLGEIGEGRFLGSLALLADAKLLFSMRATSPLTCITLTRNDFWPHVAKDQHAAAAFLGAITQGVVNWEERYLVADQCKSGRTLTEVGVSLI